MIDRARRTVTVDGRAIRPPRMMFEMCAYLADHPGAVRTRAQIMDAIGISMNAGDLAIDSHVKRARRAGLTQIKTAYGVGYYWAA